MPHRIVFTLIAVLSIVFSASAQWKQLDGPYGSLSYAIHADDTVLYYGSSEGPYKSNDYGVTWKRDITPDGRSGEDFIRIKNRLFGVFNADGISYLLDTDTIWTHTNFNIYARQLAAMDTILFAASSTGVYRSMDLGDTWTLMDNGIKPQAWMVAVVGNNLISSNNDGMLLSTDTGKTWIVTYAQTSNSLISHHNILFADAQSSTITSVDSGKIWTYLPNPPPGGATRALFSHGNVLYMSSGYSVYTSLDDGNTWTEKNNGLVRTNYTDYTSIGNVVYVASDVGVFKTIDEGDHWTNVSKGTDVHIMNSFTFKGDSMYALSRKGLYVKHVNDSAWSLRTNNKYPFVFQNVMTFKGDTIYCSGDSYLFYSIDHGKNWTYLNKPAGDINVIAANKSSVFMADGTNGQGVMRSTDNGQTWNYVNLGLGDKSIKKLACLNDTIFVCNKSGIFRSADNGNSWIKVLSQNISSTEDGFVCVQDSIVFASVIGTNGSELSISYDGGNKWQSINNPYSCIVLDIKKFKNNILFIGTKSGAYYSQDDGLTWVYIGLYGWVRQIEIYNDLVYARYGSHFYTYSIDSIKPLGIYINTNKDFQEINLYPNPVNNNLNLTIAAKNEMFCVIDLIDTQGRIVKAYSKFHLLNGDNILNLSIDNSTIEGIYILRLNFLDSFVYKRIIISK